MMLHAPIWLILIIPVTLALWFLPAGGKLLKTLRVLAAGLILFAICGPSLLLPSRSGCVVVIADRSLSMPTDAAEQQSEAIELIQSKMDRRDNLAVVTFGRDATLDQAPTGGAFSGFKVNVRPDASNLADAVDLALSLLPKDTPGRILVLSDGQSTGRSPAASAALAATRDVPIDYRLMERSSAGDVAVERIDVPSEVTPGESYMVTAWVKSAVSKEVNYKLFRGDKLLAEGKRMLDSGLTRLTFRDSSRTPGTFGYRLEVTPTGKDPVQENNTARFLVGIHGPKPLLCVGQNPKSELAELLKVGGIDLAYKQAGKISNQWTLENLSRYSAVLLEDVPATEIGHGGMQTLASWVSNAGGGLMMTGGECSYGPGGYFRSPLEPVMPVSMELRQEHRKFSIALVVVLDRSGSMAMTVSGGRTKMDLANIATAQAYDLLSAMDEFGCIAVDSTPHTIAPLAKVNKGSGVRNKILRIDSMGGGIFVYEGLLASVKMLSGATAGTRHIILFADASDSEEPGRYKELLEKCRKAGVTCSVIGLGTASDCDAGLLRDIAKRGGGRCFFTDKPQELPRLFAQDTFVVARNAFIKEATPFKITGAMTALAGRNFTAAPSLGGYNLCYLRPKANLAAVTRDEYKAPVTASWQSGLGRVLCYTGQADGKHTGDIAGWDQIGEFFASQARWTIGARTGLPQDMLVTQKTADGLCRITLHLDPDRKSPSLAKMPIVTALRGTPGGEPVSKKLQMRWETPDELVLDVPLAGQETLLATVDVPGVGRTTLAPQCLPYCPEYRPRRKGIGQDTLKNLAMATGGKQRVNLVDIWGDLPRKPQWYNLSHWLLLAAALCVLLEVLHRRTGLLTALSMPSINLKRTREKHVDSATRKRTAKALRKQNKKSSAPVEKTPEPSATKKAEPKEKEPAGIFDAFQQASSRAKDRTR